MDSDSASVASIPIITGVPPGGNFTIVRVVYAYSKSPIVWLRGDQSKHRDDWVTFADAEARLRAAAAESGANAIIGAHFEMREPIVENSASSAIADFLLSIFGRRKPDEATIFAYGTAVRFTEPDSVLAALSN